MIKITGLTYMIGAALVLASCATSAPQDLAFSEASSDALVIVVAEQGGGYLHRLKQVDMQERAFLEENVKFKVGKGQNGYLSADQNYYGMAFGIALNAKRVAPGNYAHVETAHVIKTYYSMNQYSTFVTRDCFSDKASVYSFSPGQIYLVPLERLDKEKMPFNQESIANTFKEIRQHHPNIKGSPSFAQIVDHISWGDKQTMPEIFGNSQGCEEPASFN